MSQDLAMPRMYKPKIHPPRLHLGKIKKHHIHMPRLNKWFTPNNFRKEASAMKNDNKLREQLKGLHPWSSTLKDSLQSGLISGGLSAGGTAAINQSFNGMSGYAGVAGGSVGALMPIISKLVYNHRINKYVNGMHKKSFDRGFVKAAIAYQKKAMLTMDPAQTGMASLIGAGLGGTVGAFATPYANMFRAQKNKIHGNPHMLRNAAIGAGVGAAADPIATLLMANSGVGA